MERKGLPDGSVRAYQDLYARYRLLDNLITGTSREVIEEERELLGLSFSFRYDDCRILVLGLGRRVYRLYTGSDNGYLDLSQTFVELIRRRTHECGFVANELYLNPTKEWCVLFSPDPSARRTSTPFEYASVLTQDFQRILEQSVFRGPAVHCHSSALSGPIAAYGEIAPACFALRERKKLAFFHMRPIVMDDRWIASFHLPVDAETLSERVDALWDLVLAGSAEALPSAERLCLEALKHSLDFGVCHDALTLIRNKLFDFNCRYRTGADLVLSSDINSYPTIEALSSELVRMVGLCLEVVRSQSPASTITSKAIRILRAEFSRPLTVEAVAARLRITSRYLRKTFQADLGVGVHQYLSALRIERARTLLETGGLKVAEVGATVGMPNPRYFCRFFQKETGLLPSEYAALSGKGEKPRCELF